MAKSINERAYDYAIEEAQVEGFDFGSVKDGYIQGATEQKQIDDERLEYIVSKWRKRYNDIHNALIERQGEYVSIELIEEIFRV